MGAEKVHNEHDKGYRSMLSVKRNFIELIKGFVKEPWVDEIDEEEDSLSLMNKSFVTKDYEDREADIIYRLKLNGNDVIFYCLLELQSTVDYTMPYRLLEYMTEIWREEFRNADIDARENKVYRLPVIVPMVLYNGDGRWTAVKNFKEYQQGYRLFEGHLLDFEYILFNVNDYTEEILYEMGTMIAAVFALDKKMDTAEFIMRSRRFIRISKRMTADQLVEFKNWLGAIWAARLPEDARGKLEQIINNIEKEGSKVTYAMERMLDELIEKSRTEGRTEGKTEGRTEGRMEGRMEGKTEGRTEASFEIAANMIKLGLTDDIIFKATLLPEVEIKKIKEKILQ